MSNQINIDQEAQRDLVLYCVEGNLSGRHVTCLSVLKFAKEQIQVFLLPVTNSVFLTSQRNIKDIRTFPGLVLSPLSFGASSFDIEMELFLFPMCSFHPSFLYKNKMMENSLHCFSLPLTNFFSLSFF